MKQCSNCVFYAHGFCHDSDIASPIRADALACCNFELNEDAQPAPVQQYGIVFMANVFYDGIPSHIEIVKTSNPKRMRVEVVVGGEGIRESHSIVLTNSIMRSLALGILYELSEEAVKDGGD
jgi:hypothetical protein